MPYDAAEPDEAPESQADAMRAALEAARAEVQAASEAPPNSRRSRKAYRAGATKKDKDPKQVKVTGDLLAKPKSASDEESAKPEPPSQDLPPDVVTKLKLLRRLNPTRTEPELLAQIASKQSDATNGKKSAKKRKGFFRK